MTLVERIDRARATGYEAQHQFRQMRRERALLREEFHQQLHEWRIARMRNSILVAEIKRDTLLANRAC